MVKDGVLVTGIVMVEGKPRCIFMCLWHVTARAVPDQVRARRSVE